VNQTTAFSRRALLKSGGALVVSFALATRRAPAQNAPPPGQGGGPGGRGGPPAAPAELDSFLAIHPDGRATLFTSHVDVGTGILTAYRQIAAEELGIPVERFSVVEGDTAITPDHGGTGGSSGVPRGGVDIRRAAATARRALLEMGAKQLNKPASELTIGDAEVRPASGGPGVAIAALIGGKRFALKVDPNAPLKNPATYTVVGKPILRTDLQGKATGRHIYVQDFSLPGMMHGRVIRPATVGARLLAVDEASIHGIPDVRVVRIESFLGVVAKDEWAAVRAARELKATWSEGQASFTTVGLQAAMAAAPSEREQTAVERGDTAAAISSAAKRLSATYYWPFHGHTSLAPSCAVADVKESGTSVWSSTQDAFGLRNLIARVFAIPREKVRVTYLDGSGSYGSNGAYDAAADAVLLSRAVGQPVRLQWMRADEHAWDPKGPAQLLEVRGGLDQDGNLVAWESKVSAPTGPQWTESLLGPASAGMAAEAPRGGGAPTTQNLDPPYAVPNLRVGARGLTNTPIRLSNLRAPLKIGNTFAVESFVDELAAAAAIDPVAFRRRGLSDPRALAVLDRAAAMIGWQPRPSPGPRSGAGGLLTGRGIAYMRYKQAENYVAMAMEVAVDSATGKITVRRVACAHDCGLIVNPDGLRNQVEGNILHTLSRTLHEEIQFDRSRVTSVDWASYPILTFPEVPAVQVALIDHPDQVSHGAGEAACAPVAAALGNAIFDATGIRLRSVPFASARVKAAFATAAARA
jgi:nicotinate dehydrogenase subunit B